MGSGERKRCSNVAPVRRFRSLAWMKARRLPGVRCSTLKTECRSLLCLMIMPGRSWVAGIAIAKKISFECGKLVSGRRVGSHRSAGHGTKVFMLHGLEPVWEMHMHLRSRFTLGGRRRHHQSARMVE